MSEPQKPYGSLGPDQEPIPVTGTSVDPAHQAEIAHEMPTTRLEQIAAAASAAYEDWLVFAPGQASSLNALKNKGRMISPEEANAKYASERPFTDFISELQAKEIDRRTRDRAELSSIIERGPGTVLPFATGLLTGALDPAFLAASVLTAGGAAAVRGAYLGAEAAAAARAGAGLGGEFLKAVGSNAAAMGLVEPLGYYRSEAEQRDHDLFDSLVNVGANAIIGGALHTGASRLSRALRRVSPEADIMAHEAAITQLAQDRPVNIEPLKEYIARESDGRMPLPPIEHEHIPPPAPADHLRVLPEPPVDGELAYHYVPLEDSSLLHERAFYAPTNEGVGSFHEVQKGVTEAELGPISAVTDNPFVANAEASRTVNGKEGRLFPVSIKPDTKLLNIEERGLQNGNVRAVIKPYLQEAVGKSAAKKLADSASVRDMLGMIGDAANSGKIEPDSLASIGRHLRDLGYSGYRLEGGKVLGYQAEPHNIVALFDHEGTGDAGGRMVPGDPMQANVDVKPAMDLAWFQEHARAAIDVKNDLMFDEQAHAELKQNIETPPPPPDTSVLKVKTEDLHTQIANLNEQGLQAASEAELAEIRELAQRAQLHESIAKHAFDCLGVH